MASPEDNQGQTLGEGYQLDDYSITALLGRGGFGITYKGMDERLRRAVAIKEYLPQQFAYRDSKGIVRPRSAEDAETFEWGLGRFVDEARALALFRHPNIVSVIRYFEANGTAYLIMDYEQGADLKHYLAERNDRIDERELVDQILVPVLDGLTKVHDQGLLHRDIKPDNIFIRKDGSPVLIDFGASRPHGHDATQTMTSIVSAGYSPFEQYGGGDRQGPWSDLYALAGTIYRVVTGQPPVDAIARHQGREQVPAAEAARGRYSPALLSAIDQALDLEPGARPQTAAEFRDLILHAGDTGDATYVRPAGERTQAPAPKGSRRGLLAGALIVLALAGAGTFWTLNGGLESPAPVAQDPVAAPPAPDQSTTGPANQTASAAESTPADAQPAAADTAATGNPPAVAAEPIAAPAPPDENTILADLEMPTDIRTYRVDQLAGALLAYVSNKERFDACLKAACAEQVVLMTRVQEALEGYEWTRGDYSGAIRVTNPRRLASEACPFMLDVNEVVRRLDSERRQVRTYCTTNGFDRMLQHAEPVEA